MFVYIRKIFDQDVRKQISFTKEVAQHFFDAPQSFLDKEANFTIKVFSLQSPNDLVDIELQYATDYRLSTKIKGFVAGDKDTIEVDDLLYMEKSGGGFGVKLIKKSDSNYALLNSLLSAKDRHLLLCTDEKLPQEPKSFQQILYGPPGTGKSTAVKKRVGRQAHVRTTFHPDTDFATFFGAYKPVMVQCGNGGDNGAAERIAYKFVPQAFAEAYMRAWKDLDKPIYLVIKGINRGNCAQIFGDIFQRKRA